MRYFGCMKYKFNHKSLLFEVEKTSVRQHLKKIFSYLCIGLAFAFASWIVYANFFSSPKEKRLKRELEETRLQLASMERRVNLLSHVLKDLEEKDDHVYRSLLEAEPVKDRNQWMYRPEVPVYTNANTKSINDLSRKIDLLTARTQVALRSYEELWGMIGNKEERLAHVPAISPVKNPKIISGFGMRYHPIYNISRRHTGVDFAGKRGEPVYATADGVVRSDGAGSGYGISVVLNHGNGYQTVYAHLSKKAVRDGQKVKRGEVVGYMGSSGLSSGVHLHYEVIKNGQKINPIHFFFGDLSPEEYDQLLRDATAQSVPLS